MGNTKIFLKISNWNTTLALQTFQYTMIKVAFTYPAQCLHRQPQKDFISGRFIYQALKMYIE